MRRTKLVWFAVGAAAVLLSYLVTSVVLAERETPKQLTLVVLAPDVFPADGANTETDSVSFTTGEVIRDCGNDKFDMQLSPHHGIGYEIPVTVENRKGLECLIQSLRTMDKAVSISLEVR